MTRTTATGSTREERHDEVLRRTELQHALRRRRSRERALLARVTRG